MDTCVTLVPLAIMKGAKSKNVDTVSDIKESFLESSSFSNSDIHAETCWLQSWKIRNMWLGSHYEIKGEHISWAEFMGKQKEDISEQKTNIENLCLVQ